VDTSHDEERARLRKHARIYSSCAE